MAYRPSPELVAANAALVHQLKRQAERAAFGALGQSENCGSAARAAEGSRASPREGTATGAPRGQAGHRAKGNKPWRETGNEDEL